MEKIYKDLLKEIWTNKDININISDSDLEKLNSEDETISSMMVDIMINKLNKCKVTIEFSGSGDSGNSPEAIYEEDNRWLDALYPDSIDVIIAQKVDFDYYNNEGGFGTIEIDYKKQTCHIIGNEYYEAFNEVQNEILDL